MVALKNCLKGSRLTIYENIVKDNKRFGITTKDAKAVFADIKTRLFRFLETDTERQLRVAREWDNMHKSKGMSALAFEADWERRLRDLSDCGLGKNVRELFLA